jgi:hypothetical protein
MFETSKPFVFILINFLHDLYDSSDVMQLNVTKLDPFHSENCLPRRV